jgi:hypothetical protein
VVGFADVMKHMRKNNGSLNENGFDEQKGQTSNLMSPWSSKSSRASKSFAPQASPNLKLKKHQSYRPDSDSTSMSTDSDATSLLTQHSVSQLDYFLNFYLDTATNKLILIFSVKKSV